uniref:SFRICE_038492 n=1 Tax=Spodoptera frugiperda TaxID=7108 RepID=A0A2H1WT79_SPOFR
MRAQQRRAEGIKSPAEGGRGARVPLSPARSLATTPPTTARCASSRCEWFAVTDRYGVHHNIALDLRPVASRDLSAGPSLWSAPHAPDQTVVKWTWYDSRMTMKSLKYSEREEMMEGFSPVPPPLPRRQPVRNIYAEPFVDPSGCAVLCAAINHIFILGARSAAAGTQIAQLLPSATPQSPQLNFNRFEGESQLLIPQYQYVMFRQ